MGKKGKGKFKGKFRPFSFKGKGKGKGGKSKSKFRPKGKHYNGLLFARCSFVKVLEGQTHMALFL